MIRERAPTRGQSGGAHTNESHESRSVFPIASINRWRSSELIVASLLAVAGCGGELPEWCPASSDVVTSVVDKPVSWNANPKFVELWEAGSAEGKAFVAPSAVSINPKSRVAAVADHVLTSVTFVSADGKTTTRWSKPGKGELELNSPVALDWTSDASLDVLDIGNAKVLRLGAGGTPIGEFPIGRKFRAHLYGVSTALRGSSVVVQQAPESTGTPGEAVVRIVRGRNLGEEVDTVVSGTIQIGRGADVSSVWADAASIPSAAPLANGLVAIGGDIAQFRIVIKAENGRIVRQICVPDAMRLLREDQRSTAGPGKSVAHNSVRIGRIFARSDGAIWVQRNTLSGPELLDHWFGPLGATYDVFAPDGKYRGTVRAPSNTRVADAIGDTVLGLRSDSRASIFLAAFRLEPVK